MRPIAAAVEQPPHLRAIVPIATSIDPYEAIYHGGLLSTTFVTGWLKGIATFNAASDRLLRGRLLQMAERVLKQPYIHSRFEHCNGEAALAVLGKLLPKLRAAAALDDFLIAVAVDHQTKDEFWRARDLTPLLSRVRAPVYLGCDWANVPMHLPSTFTAMRALTDAVPLRVALLKPGGLSWPWESLHLEALAWFDQWLKQVDTGVLDGPPVRYCVPGAEDGWRVSDGWPPAGMQHVALYLRADGTLGAEAGSAGMRSYVYLPQGRTPSRLAVESAPSSLIWESEPLSGALEMAGPAELILEAAITAIDTGWIATLQDVGPDGRATNVTAGWLRAALRAVDEPGSSSDRPVRSYEREEAVVPNERVTYRIGLVDNARHFRPGHRIRLVLASDDVNDGPAIMGFQHASVGLASRNAVFSASRLLLPVVSGSDVLTR